MGFGAAVQSAFKKTFNYQGRASRSEYWWFYLFYLLSFTALITVFMVILGIASDHNRTNDSVNPMFGALGLLGFLYLLAMLVVQLPLSIRRLHDSGKSGFFLLLTFVPFGGIVLLVFFCLPGTNGANQYGDDPIRPLAGVF